MLVENPRAVSISINYRLAFNLQTCLTKLLVKEIHVTLIIIIIIIITRRLIPMHRLVSISSRSVFSHSSSCLRVSLSYGARGYAFLTVSQRAFVPLSGPRTKLHASRIVRLSSRARASGAADPLFQFDDTRGSRIGNERPSLWAKYRLVARFRPAESTRFFSALFALSLQHCRRRESGERQDRDDCINPLGCARPGSK